MAQATDGPLQKGPSEAAASRPPAVGSRRGRTLNLLIWLGYLVLLGVVADLLLRLLVPAPPVFLNEKRTNGDTYASDPRGDFVPSRDRSVKEIAAYLSERRPRGGTVFALSEYRIEVRIDVLTRARVEVRGMVAPGVDPSPFEA